MIDEGKAKAKRAKKHVKYYQGAIKILNDASFT